MRKATIVLLTLLWASSSWAHGPQLRGPFLTPGSVTETRLADLSVAEAKIQALAVTSGKLAANSVDEEKLVVGVVTTAKVATDAITNLNLLTDAASLLKVSGGVMTSDGTNIGIGTSTPLSTLEVAGNFAVSGASVYQGSITVNADVLIKSSLTITSSNSECVNIDGDTLVVDCLNNKVGIGRTNPLNTIHLDIDGGNVGITYTDRGSQEFTLGIQDGTTKFEIAGGSVLGTNVMLTIDSNGNTGINETSPNARLEVKAALADQFTLQISSQNGTEIMVVDRLGNVGIGIAPDVTAKLHILVSGSAKFGGDSFGTGLHIRAANVAVQNNGGHLVLETNDAQSADIGGMLGFGGNRTDGLQNSVVWATISGRKENSNSADVAGYLRFRTRPTGGSTTDRMRITSTGDVGIGQNAPSGRLEIKPSVSNAFTLVVSSQNGTAIMVVDRLGHIIATGADPVITSCGTTPSVSGSDRAGNVTIGTEVTTSCTVTFAEPYASTPSCTVTGDNTAVTYARTISATVLTIISSADMASDVVSYNCMGL